MFLRPSLFFREGDGRGAAIGPSIFCAVIEIRT